MLFSLPMLMPMPMWSMLGSYESKWLIFDATDSDAKSNANPFLDKRLRNGWMDEWMFVQFARMEVWSDTVSALLLFRISLSLVTQCPKFTVRPIHFVDFRSHKKSIKWLSTEKHRKKPEIFIKFFSFNFSFPSRHLGSTNRSYVIANMPCMHKLFEFMAKL